MVHVYCFRNCSSDHPDIEEFVQWKTREEHHKVTSLVAGSHLIHQHLENIKSALAEGSDLTNNKALLEACCNARKDNIPSSYIFQVVEMMKAGVYEEFTKFDTSWESEAYRTISGQNSNNSIRVTNDFMHKVYADEQFDLQYRTTQKVAKSVNAKQLWRQIATCAWKCADPGIQFDTTINDWHTCPNSGRINASNPCSEYMFLDDTACNLASINLVQFLKNKTFDHELFAYVVKLMAIMLEISIFMSQFPYKLCALKSYQFRTIGLGHANLGGLLMRQGIAYDSDLSRTYASWITGIMQGVAYKTSAEIAAFSGPFQEFEKNQAPMLKVLHNHNNVVLGKDCVDVSVQPPKPQWDLLAGKQIEYLRNTWKDTIKEATAHGLKNAQVTVIAPTGTIGLVQDCDTLSIEPDFALVKMKTFAGGGMAKLVNHSVPFALESLGYSTEESKHIIEHIAGTGTLKNAPFVNHDSLMSKGLNKTDLDNIEKQIKFAYSLDNAVSIDVLTETTLKALDLFKYKTHATFSLLQWLNFTETEIELAAKHVFGTGTTTNAPYLKDEHHKIFHCANDISVEGHLKMMAAIQPMISGAISKTVNMHHTDTIDSFLETYTRSHQLGIKAVAAYRDQSKLSQPLSAVHPDSFESTLNRHEKTRKPVLKRSEKETLGYRLSSYRQKFQISGYTLYLNISKNDYGEIKELFISGLGNEGSTARSLMNCLAKSISIGLQYGVPLEAFVDALRHSSFDPAGRVLGHPTIKHSSSIVDLLAQELDREHKTNYTTVQQSVEKPQTKSQASESTLHGMLNGQVCPNCKHMTVRSVGACLQCYNCGHNTGCE